MKAILASSVVAFLAGTYGINTLQSYASKLPEISFSIPDEVAQECRVDEFKALSYTVWEYRDPIRGWTSVPAVNDCMVNYLVTEAQLRGHRTMVTRNVEFMLMETGAEYLLEKKGKR